MNSYERLMKEKSERIWVQQNTHIHVLNYWFYRWFTKSYYRFLLTYFSDREAERDAKSVEGEKSG